MGNILHFAWINAANLAKCFAKFSGTAVTLIRIWAIARVKISASSRPTAELISLAGFKGFGRALTNAVARASASGGFTPVSK